MNQTAATKKIFRIESLKASCQTCRMQELCLPFGIPDADVEILDKIVAKKAPIPRGANLFNAGDPFGAIYVPRTGALKTLHVDTKGTQAIVGFHLPGELVGLDGIADNRHTLTAQALETTSVCRVGFDELEQVARQVPSLQRQLSRLMSKEFLRAEQHLLMIGNRAAEEKVAIFLLSLSKRFENRGFSRTTFNLPMARIDIAAYLGLASETVSRVFSTLREAGLMDVEGRLVTLKDFKTLGEMTGQPE